MRTIGGARRAVRAIDLEVGLGAAAVAAAWAGVVASGLAAHALVGVARVQPSQGYRQTDTSIAQVADLGSVAMAILGLAAVLGLLWFCLADVRSARIDRTHRAHHPLVAALGWGVPVWNLVYGPLRIGRMLAASGRVRWWQHLSGAAWVVTWIAFGATLVVRARDPWMPLAIMGTGPTPDADGLLRVDVVDGWPWWAVAVLVLCAAAWTAVVLQLTRAHLRRDASSSSWRVAAGNRS